MRPLSKLALISCSLLFVAACNKQENQGSTAAGSAGTTTQVAKSAGTEAVASGSLLMSLPSESLAVMSVNTGHPAYKKLIASAWADYAKISHPSSHLNAMPEFATALKKAGIDPADPRAVEEVLSEYSMFMAPVLGKKPGTPGDSLAYGVVIRSRKPAALAKLVSVLKEELKASGKPVGDLTIGGVPGFRTTLSGAVPELDGPPVAAEQSLFFAVKDNIGVAASSDAAAAALLKNSTSAPATAPAFLTSAAWKNATSSLPPESERFALGYVDVAGLFSQPDIRKDAPLQEQPPIQAVGLAAGMQDAPIFRARMTVLDSKKDSIKNVGSAISATFSQVLPANPMFLIHVDGETIRSVKNASMPPGMPVPPEFESVLANLIRVGIAAKTAAPGQSMLPIPDLLVNIETKKPAEVVAMIKQQSEAQLAATGIPGLEWAEKDIEGKKVKMLPTPLGSTVYLSSSDTAVLLTTNEDVLRASLKAGTSSPFLASLPAQAAKSMSATRAIGGLYLDFAQLAPLVETAGSMLPGAGGMGGPMGGGMDGMGEMPPMDGTDGGPSGMNPASPPPSAGPISNEMLTSLKNMGQLLLTSDLENDGITINVSSLKGK